MTLERNVGQDHQGPCSSLGVVLSANGSVEEVLKSRRHVIRFFLQEDQPGSHIEGGLGVGTPRKVSHSPA